MNAPLKVETPSLRGLFTDLIQEVMAKFNCHQLGTIQSVNAAKNTVTVSINVLRVTSKVSPTGQDPTQSTPPAVAYVTYPILVDVPFFIMSGGGGVITMPIAQGDTCLVMFNDRDIDAWFTTGGVVAPNSSRMHDLADGLALVGFRSLSNLVAAYSTTDIQIKNGGGQISVAAKINISNGTTSLLTLMTNLITALTSWVDTHGDIPNAITLYNLNNVQTLINALLK